MQFVGEVNVLEPSFHRAGESAPLFVRPHELELLDGPQEDSIPATVRRLTTFGRDFQVELELEDGQRLVAQLNRDQVKGRLEQLVSGLRTHVGLRGGRQF
jgi:ABC-type sulfate/molybdate transport systems ATPase subunit